MITNIRLACAVFIGTAVFALSLPGSAAGAVPSRGSGSHIVWTRDRTDTTSGQLILARPDGRGEVALTDPASGVKDLNAVISPDGTRVVFERDLADGSTRIGVVDSDGSHVRLLNLGCVDPCVVDLDPSWSPDGRQIYFNRVFGPFDPVNGAAASAVLWRADLDGSHLRRVSQNGIDGAFEDSHARFAPGGAYLTFVRLRDSDGRTAVFRMNLDARHVRQLTPWRLGGDEPDISPATHGLTKDLVVFETFGGGASQRIATVPSTCTSVKNCAARIHYLTHDGLATSSFNPTWAPTGREVAFARQVLAAGPPVADIWRVSWDGHHATQISRSPLFEFRPDWGQ